MGRHGHHKPTSEIPDDALDLESRPAEVEEQAYRVLSRLQVVQALSGVRLIQLLHGFHFEDDGLFHQQIENALSERSVLVPPVDPD